MRLDVTWCSPQSHFCFGRQGLVSTDHFHLSTSSRGLVRLRVSNQQPRRPLSKPRIGRSEWCGEKALWEDSVDDKLFIWTWRGGQTGTEKLSHDSSYGIPICLPCTGHRGAPLHSFYAQSGLERGASVCHHHVSGNSFNNRCVQDWFYKHRWQPWPE